MCTLQYLCTALTVLFDLFPFCQHDIIDMNSQTSLQLFTIYSSGFKCYTMCTSSVLNFLATHFTSTFQIMKSQHFSQIIKNVENVTMCRRPSYLHNYSKNNILHNQLDLKNEFYLQQTNRLCGRSNFIMNKTRDWQL